MRKYFWLFGLALLLTVAISAGVTTYINQQYFAQTTFVEREPARTPQFVKTNASPQIVVAETPESFTNTAAVSLPAVVNITAYGNSGYQESGGSGVIISSDGYIATNYHVVEEGRAFKVSLDNKRDYRAEVIGVDPTTDLALIKIDAEGLPALRFGDSDRARVGEWVLAVGNPFDLNSTVTAGIVSAKGRAIGILDDRYRIESFIQTDAVVNPGNSGGALVNTKGELIGINTAILSKNGGYEGYSFAVPSNLAKKIMRDLREYGTVKRALLGINIGDVDEKIADRYDLPSVNGVYISGVVEEGSAERAGLQPEDVIVRVNGLPTNTTPELQELVGRLRPGTAVSVEFYRNGKLYVAENVKLGGLNEDAVVAPAGPR